MSLVRPLRLLIPSTNLTGSSLILLEHAFQLPYDLNGVFPIAQRLHHGAPGRHITHFPSRKQGGSLACHGTLMRNRCLLLEADQSITAYRTIPATLPIGSARYTPSLAYKRRDGSLTVEHLVYDGQLTEDVRSEGATIARHLLNEGISFSFALASDVESQPRLDNMMYCYRGRRTAIPDDTKLVITRFLESNGGSASIRSLRRQLSVECHQPLLIFHLLWDGFLTFDSNVAITERTKIWLTT